MEILRKIKQILYNQNLDLEDKLIEIQGLLPLEKEPETAEVFGQKVAVRLEGNAIVFDGSIGATYVDNHRLENPDDIYYTGCGCTWDTDLDGNRYHKRYSPFLTKSDRYRHLSYGDIINEKARIKKIVMECLSEI